MFGFINKDDKVIWPPKRHSSADVSSVGHSSDSLGRRAYARGVSISESIDIVRYRE